jgi:hypothetical protein
LLFNPPIFPSFIPFLTFSVTLFLFVIMYLFLLGISLSLSLSCVELARAQHHGWIFPLLPVLWQKLNMPVDVWQWLVPICQELMESVGMWRSQWGSYGRW